MIRTRLHADPLGDADGACASMLPDPLVLQMPFHESGAEEFEGARRPAV